MQTKNQWENRSVSFFSRLLLYYFLLQLRLLQTRNSALSLESKYQQFYRTKNCASIPKIKLKQCCRCHLPPSNIFMQNFYRNGKFHVQRDACRRKIDGKIVAFLSPVFSPVHVQTVDDGKLCPLHLKGNINSPIKFINCVIFPEGKT